MTVIPAIGRLACEARVLESQRERLVRFVVALSRSCRLGDTGRSFAVTSETLRADATSWLRTVEAHSQRVTSVGVTLG